MILIHRQTTASTLSNMVDALKIRRVSQSLWLRERMVRNATVVHLYNMRSPFFFSGEGGGGGGGAWQGGQTCRLSYLVFPAPIPFFLSFLPLSLFLYRNIMHCYVISPYCSCFPPFYNSHSSLPFLSRTLHSSCHRLSRAPSPCPHPLFSFLNFFFQTSCGEQAFHLGEVVIIKFLHRTAVTAHLQQFSLFKHAFVFQIL